MRSPSIIRTTRGVVLALAILTVTSGRALAAPVIALKGLQVYPLRSKPKQNPGDTTTGQITVANNTKAALNVTMSVELFKVTDEDYDYSFSKGSNTNWVRLADTAVGLPVGASKDIAYSLAVPNNVSPGSYYFAIMASSASGASSTTFNEVKRVASLIYLQVNGPVTKKINLLGVDSPWLVTRPSLAVDSRLINQGNIYLESTISESIVPLYGRAIPAVSVQGLILPSTIRKLHSVVPFSGLPGLYHLEIRYAAPQGGNQLIHRTFIYAPTWFLLTVAGVVLLVVDESRRLRKRRQRKKRIA